MSDEQQIKFLGDVQRLTLAPDDILVIKSHRQLSMEMVERIRESMANLLGADRKVIVIDNGMDIGVLSPTSEG